MTTRAVGIGLVCFLGGYLADALHNVPSILWQYNPDGWYKPQRIEAWLTAFPSVVQSMGAPENISKECERILAKGGEAHELGVHEDLGNFDLAATERLEQYLDLIEWAFVEMRVMRNYGAGPLAPWQELDQVWTKEADTQAAYNSLVASVLLPVPSGLVQWGQFDEAAFRQTALASDSGLLVGDHIRAMIQALPEDKRTGTQDRASGSGLESHSFPGDLGGEADSG